MATATFDTLKFANTLKAAGVPDKQAEAQATVLSEAISVNFKELVTKDDLKVAVDGLRQEINVVRQEVNGLRQEMRSIADVLRQEMKNQTDALRAELKNQTDALRAEMKIQTDVIRHEMKEMEQRLSNRLDVQKAEMLFLKWMIGGVGFAIFGVLIRMFAFRGGL